MMGLLVEIPYAGASCDYLYARIRCRRASLDASGLSFRTTRGDPQQALLAEYRWVYRQLEQRLRRKLLPVFEFFELRLLVISLRYLAAGNRSAMIDQLKQSLFQANVLSSLQSSDNVAAVLSRLEQLLGEAYPVFQDLTETYLRQGPGGLEQALSGGYLQAAVARSRAPQVRQFLLYLLDMRNLQALQKHLRWQVPLPPPLMSGGSIDIAEYEKIWAQQDQAALLELLKNFTRQSGITDESDVEDILLQELTDRLQRAGRDPLQMGLIIDYLWRCQQSAREQGVQLFRNSEKNAGLVTEESG
jgi:vacuolar-type H+-ATPase subunit C/Vma6